MTKKRHPRMPPHLLILQMILAVALTSGSLLAAAVEEPAEGPAAETSAPDPRWEKREERAEGFKSRFLLSRKAVEAGATAEMNARKERAEKRRTCRESIRKANRDQRFARLAVCVRDDLALAIAMLEARSQIIASTPGISEEFSELTIARGDLLLDALRIVIDAIDANVYADEAGLLEARKNLREKYLLPYWALLPRLRAEHSLAWISHLLVRMRSLKDGSSLSETVAAALDRAQECLVEAEETLETALDEKESNAMNIIISQVRSDAISCVHLYRDAMTIRGAEAASAKEERAEPQWQKRSSHKLPTSRF